MFKIKDNIWKFYLYEFFGSLVFFLPFFIIFLTDNGLTLTEAIATEVIYFAAILLLEVPTGAFADIYGRKNSIMIGAGILLFSLFLWSIGTTFWWFVFANLVWAIGHTLISGADNALVYDSLKSMKREEEFSKIIGQVYFLLSIAGIIAFFASDFIAKVSLRHTFYVTLIPFFLMFLVTTTLKEPKAYRKVKVTHWNQMKDSAVFAWKHRKIRWLLIYASIIAFSLTTAFWFYQPYMKEIGLPITNFGAAFAIFALFSGIVSKYAYKIEFIIGEKITMFILPILAIIPLICMGLIKGMVGLVFVLIHYVISGYYGPVISHYIQRHIPSEKRATISSLKNATRTVLFTIFALIFARIADIISVQATFLILGVFLIAFFIPILYYYIKWKIYDFRLT